MTLERGRHRAPSVLTRPARVMLRACTDVLSFFLCVAIVDATGRWGGVPAAQTLVFLLLAGPVFVAVMLGLAARGHYGLQPLKTNEPADLAAASAAALIGSGFLAYLLAMDPGRWMLTGFWVGYPVLAMGLRRALHVAMHRTKAWRRNLVVVGHGEAAERALHLLQTKVGDGWMREWAIAGVLHPTRIGPMEHGRWQGVLRQHEADLVVLAMDDLPSGYAEWLVRDRVDFALMPPAGLPVRGLPARRRSHDAMLWCYGGARHAPLSRIGKRAMDVAGAAALLVLTLPVLALVAAAVKLDGGPALYGHRRIGVRGRPFSCLKFRSMVPQAEQVLNTVLSADPAAAAEWESTQKLRNDPRVTRFGQLLRQTSLDELPQLFNVLRGDMSLVGPRPIVTAEVPRYGDDIHLYYAARPGLTGLWQVSGRSDTGYGERVQLDSWYVKNWSLWADVTILAKTVPAVLRRRGAV